MKKTLKTLMIITGLLQGTTVCADNLRIYSGGGSVYTLTPLGKTNCGDVAKIEKEDKGPVSCIFHSSTNKSEVLTISAPNFECQIQAEQGKIEGSRPKTEIKPNDNSIHLP